MNKHSNISFEPSISVEITPTIQEAVKPQVKYVVTEATTTRVTSLKEVLNVLDISAQTLVNTLDKYFSDNDLATILAYTAKELDVDIEPVTEELNPEKLLDKVPDNELRDIVKSSGVNLKGDESKEELTGMVKALAATNESVKQKLTSAKEESTKLKRKKGIEDMQAYVESHKNKAKPKLSKFVKQKN